MLDVEGFRDIAAELAAFEKKEVKAKVQSEYLFDLDEIRSVKTIHPANDGNYDGIEVDKGKRSTRKKAHNDSGDSRKRNADDESTSSEESGSSDGSAGKG